MTRGKFEIYTHSQSMKRGQGLVEVTLNSMEFQLMAAALQCHRVNFIQLRNKTNHFVPCVAIRQAR